MTYEFKTIDLKNSKSESFNPIDNIKHLDLETKANVLEVLYNSSQPCYVSPVRLTVSNFKIQEYRALHSKNLREFLIKDFKIPALFPLERQQYEELVLIVAEDCNFYDYSKINQSNRLMEK